MLPLNLVSVEGFEPPTLYSQSRCATGLRYTLKFATNGWNRTNRL